MGFLDDFGNNLKQGLSHLNEKNKRAAHINRIRSALKREEAAARREYIALGKYYYNTLRDKNDLIAERHCAELAKIDVRIDALVDQISKHYAMIAREKAELKEEISLDDVQCFDEIPKEFKTKENINEVGVSAAMDSDSSKVKKLLEDYGQQPVAPAAEDENDALPFE